MSNNENNARDFLFELSIDLTAIQSTLIIIYDSLMSGSGVPDTVIAESIDGLRRHLERLTSDLEDISVDFDLVKRDKNETA